ncbi:hypothetical protein GE21DRAFT_1085349 [Neurospora crassa]|nr:hypothetical protein GE21DRAFT_1085349 [Neurospora crassa]
MMDIDYSLQDGFDQITVCPWSYGSLCAFLKNLLYIFHMSFFDFKPSVRIHIP